VNAIPMEPYAHDKRTLEPDGRGHELLTVWALYRRGGERMKSPVASGGWSERLDAEHVNEPESVLAIDRILAGLFKSGFEDTVDMVRRFYLSNLSIWQVAQKMRRTDGFVRLTLRGVCAIVDERVVG